MKIKNYRHLLVILPVLIINILHGQDWKELNPPYNQFNAPILASVTDLAGNIYAAGKFTNAANERFVTKWDGSQWTEVGTGLSALHANNDIFALTRDPAGNIYAAGAFYNSTGNIYVAKWNGSAWLPLGTGAAGGNFNGFIYTLTTDAAGNVYAAGNLNDGSGKYYVVKWNGSSWSPLGNGANALNANGLIYSLASDSTGNIYAAGHFTNANGKYYVAKWNGTAWTEAGNLGANQSISSLSSDKTGNIYAGGYFTNAGGYTYVAKWNGTTWSELGAGGLSLRGNGPIKTILCNASGTVVYAAGLFTNNTTGSFSVARWNGTGWAEQFQLPDYSYTGIGVNTLSFDPAGNLYAAGGFKNDAGNCYLAKWNGSTLTDLGHTGSSLRAGNGIHAITADRFGNVYAEGNFSSNNNGVINTLAKWDGKGWNPVPGMSTSNVGSSGINAMVTDSSGNLYIGGSVFQNYVEKWDGISWTKLGGANSNLNPVSPIASLKTDKAGNIYASGLFTENNYLYGVAKWNGNTWSHFGGTPEPLRLIAVDPSGKVYSIGSDFYQYYISRIDSCCGYIRGLASPNIVNPNGAVYGFEADGRGNFYAGGTFFDRNTGGFVLKWDGTNFSQLLIPTSISNSEVTYALASDPSGTVYASIHNSALSGSLQDYVSKWNGTTWVKLGGTASTYYFNSVINTIQFDPNGNLYAAGLFGNSAGYQFVAEYEGAYAAPAKPRLSGLSASYCQSGSNQKVKLLNPPAAQFGTVTIKIDTTTLTYNADSSFSITPSGLSASMHQLKVIYNYGGDIKQLDTSFLIMAGSVPRVGLSSNIINVVNLTDPVQLTASNLSGGGLSPTYTFSKDRLFSNVLQSESPGIQLLITPSTLSVGDNWIYVRMRTSDSCYSIQTNIDSIKITRSIITGITDIDFPNTVINVYPNPFRQIINLNGLNNAKTYLIKVINSAGQNIFTGKYSVIQSISIYLPVLNTGIYRVGVYDDKKKRLIGTVTVFKE